MTQVTANQRFGIGMIMMCATALMFIWTLMFALNNDSFVFALLSGVFLVITFAMFRIATKG